MIVLLTSGFKELSIIFEFTRIQNIIILLLILHLYQFNNNMIILIIN